MKFNIRADKRLMFLMLLLSACLAAGGQLLFKFGVLSGVSMPLLIVGLVSYAAATGIYFVVLSRSHLSWAYGLNGMSYVITVFLAFSVLHENIPIVRWVGVLVIAIGAALIGSS